MQNFKEIQKAFRPWLLAAVLVPWAAFIYFCYYAIKNQIINGIPVGTNPVSNEMLIAILIILNLVFIFFVIQVFALKLEINIDKHSIRFIYFPLLREKQIENSKIAYAYVRKYKSIKEYSGWGIRTLMRQKAYNVWGKWGIQIITTNNKFILLGTQKPEEAKQMLENIGFGSKPEKR